MRQGPFIAILSVLAAFVVTTGAARAEAVAPAPASSTVATEQTPEERLAIVFSRVSAFLIRGEDLSMRNLTAAVILLREATDLDPGNPELWRTLVGVSLLAERDDLYARAVQNLARLEPGDQVTRLRKLNLAIESIGSAEERISAYKRLLDPKHRTVLGAPVASRLAFDLALLLRRHGDLDGFAQWLGEAAAIDPANRAAAATAAGFFRVHVDDAYGEAELLVNLMLADPTDITTQTSLARLLLQHGAYQGAERLYRISTASHGVLRRLPASELLADQAIAHWATGNDQAALDLIAGRQQKVNQRIRSDALRDSPELDPLERARLQGHVRPTLATVRAAIHVAGQEIDALSQVTQALAAYDAVIEKAVNGDEPDAAVAAQYRMEQAWVAIWLAGDDQLVGELIDQAEQFQPLTETARTLFEGWRALRRGEYEAAITTLSTLPETEAARHLGIAEAHEALGRRRDAARSLLVAARIQPGSLIGVWSANRLNAWLGRAVPVSDVARRLEELTASIPSIFDRFAESPTLAIGFRLEPAKTVFGPYEPVILNVIVKNNSRYPLAIDRDGPIRPQVIVGIVSSFAQTTGTRPEETIIVDIDRRLRLEPYEQLVVPVDLRRHDTGREFQGNARGGMFIEARGMINFRADQNGAILPGLLGLEQRTVTFRVDGARIDGEWMAQAVSAVEDPNDPGDLMRLGLMGHVLSDRLATLSLAKRNRDALLAKTDVESRAQLEHLERQVTRLERDLERERSPILDAFERLEPSGQAWMLAALPATTLLDPIRELAATIDSRHVRFVYLMFHVREMDDPVLQAVLQSDDEELRLMADATVERIERDAAIRRLPVASGSDSDSPSE